MSKAMILSVGMPRAGSGWFYNLTQDLILANEGSQAREIRSKYRLNRLLTEVNCNIGTLSFYRLIPVMLPLLFESPYVIKLHAERRPLADQLIKAGLIKPTFIYRDPRDALLSAYEYGQRMTAEGRENAFTPLTSLDLAIDFMDFYVKVAEGWINLPGAFLIRYEDLKENYDQEVAGLLDFLGIDPQDQDVIQIIENYRPGQKPRQEKGMHFVKGKIGRYQEKFTPAQLKRCDALFGDFLDRYGYQRA